MLLYLILDTEAAERVGPAMTFYRDRNLLHNCSGLQDIGERLGASADVLLKTIHEVNEKFQDAKGLLKRIFAEEEGLYIGKVTPAVFGCIPEKLSLMLLGNLFFLKSKMAR